MALLSRPEEDFTCVLCEDVFSEPVSTPCGHNFCQSCISVRWRGPGPYHCPTCRQSYTTRPQLRVNSFIHNMVQRFRDRRGSQGSLTRTLTNYSLNGSRSTIQSDYSPNETNYSPNGTNYSPNGTEYSPNRTEYSPNGSRSTFRSDYGSNGTLTAYGLNGAPSTTQSIYSLGSMWSDYGPTMARPSSQVMPRAVFCDFCAEPKSLAVKFCRDCSSSYCEVHLQPHHEVQGLRRHLLLEPGDHQDQRPDHRPDQKQDQKAQDLYSGAYTLSGRKVQLRLAKLQEIRVSAEQSKRAADLKAAEVVTAFNAVVQEVQTSLDRFTQIIEETQTQTQGQAQSMVQQLEHEIQELRERESGDQLIFLHNHSVSLKPVALKDWDGVFLAPPPLDRRVVEVVLALEGRVSELLGALHRNLELRRLQSHAVTLTFDPNTAHRKLVLSNGETAVHHSVDTKKTPGSRRSKERFTECYNVMTKQSFSSGSFYFEVQVEGKSDWDVGVAKKSVKRKKKVPLCPANGFWMIWLRDGARYQALEALPVTLAPGRTPQKVGVFVDCDAGVVSFYDADTGALLYSFSDCAFKGPILPILNPCVYNAENNAAPLVLTPVSVPSDPVPDNPPGPPAELREPVYYSFGSEHSQRK